MNSKYINHDEDDEHEGSIINNNSLNTDKDHVDDDDADCDGDLRIRLQ